VSENKEKEIIEETVEQTECECTAEETSEKDALQLKITELEQSANEYKDKWYRVSAEFENYKKRNAETRKNAYEDGKIEAIKKIIFIGDNLDRALSYSIDEQTKEGLNMLIRQYGEIMANLGLEIVNPVGEVFDPNLHEAIFTKPCEEGQEAGIIDSVFLKGYKMGDKTIRYAQVVVTQ